LVSVFGYYILDDKTMINLHKIGKFLWKALPWALLVLAAIFLFQKWQLANRANHNVAVLQGEVTTYQNKIGSLTTTVGTLQLTKRQLEQSILKKDDSLKKLASEFSRVKSIVETEIVLQIDSIHVPFDLPVPYDFERTGKKADQWYSFNYNVNQNGLSLTNFETWTETTTITGFKRNWFLGRQRVTTDVTHTNPHITTTNIKAIEVVVPVKWHETRMFNLGVGFLAGAYIFSRQ